MSRFDQILRMIVRQGGSRLELQSGEPPRLFHGDEPLRFFLPPLGATLLKDLVVPALEPPDRRALEAGEAVRARYSAPEIGVFRLDARAEGGQLFIAIHREADPEAPPKGPAAKAPEAPQGASARPPPRLHEADAPSPQGPRVPTAPAARLGPDAPLGRLLAQAMGAGASDLHLSDGEPPRMRQDGRLRPLPEADPVEDLGALLRALLTEPQVRRLATGASVDLALDVLGAGRVRGSVFRHQGGLAAAFRIIARAAPSLDRLELGVDLSALTALSHGLIIAAGPTGAGKSTTLAALAAAALARNGGVLLTLEDPVEYVFEAPPGGLVRQRAVGVDVPDFATGLRDALRADPDHLLVGEMRDPESISLALTAAETGHLVFSTLHASTAAAAVERIVDAYPPERQRQIRVQLADALQAVVAQRLLPRADGPGRVVAAEVLRNTHAVAGLIRDGRTAQLAHALQGGAEAGMRPLARSLAERVRQGRISLADARAQAPDPGSLEAYLRP